MWQSWKEQKGKNVAEGDKYQHFDSGHVDSGFLSGGNLVSTEEGLEFDRQACKSGPVVPEPSIAVEPMRADSGVDLGLSDNLSQLTLKPVTLNPLSGKVQSEPTIELTPVTTQLSQSQFQPQQRESVQPNINVQHHQHVQIQQQQQQRHDWPLYYMQDDDGDTHLHNAIAQGFLEVAFSLIKMAPHPCLLDILNDEQLSPLHLAVITHQARIVRSLVLAGANPALRDGNGNTALHLACASGDMASARALTDPLSLSEKRFTSPGRPTPALPQDLEQRNYEGQSCLHTAVLAGNVDMVRLLLRHGADLEAGEWLAGRTALHLAIEQHRTSVTTFLLQECAPRLDAPTYAGITAYQIAACRDLGLARELVKLGAKPQPPPESDSEESNSDSEMSEDSENEGDEGGNSTYHVQMSQLWHSVGLRA
ncbi:NF-kappa-B inhibitor cactus-like [Athalia rosae]|uniref:NF-kappa-B inhibitor cactus-like n=1 Tax=Athalia rosae TaxID=37344 RepID=UPI00203356AA|nr:NF-kappa-B inhibitor cactus-like [Athalia rosae]